MVSVRADTNLSILMLNGKGRSNSDQTLCGYRLLFGVESAFGVQRLSVQRGVLRPPSLISQVYSIAIACSVLFYTISYLALNRSWQIPDEPESLISYIFNIYGICLALAHFTVVFKNIFFDRSKMVELVDNIRHIDNELNLPANHDIFKLIFLKNCFIIIIVSASYLFIGVIWARIGFYWNKELPLLGLMALFELQLLICGSFLVGLQLRLRHITAHVAHNFSLQTNTTDGSHRPLWIKLFMFSFRVDKMTPEKATFEVNISTIFGLYDKLLQAFNSLNNLFTLQVVLFFSINFASLLISIFSFIKMIQSEHTTVELCLATFSWWHRMGISILYPSFCADDLTKAAEELREALLALLGDFQYQEHHKAAASLLRYCELSKPHFNVLSLFEMNINLPFSYITLVVTYLIVLLQFYSA